MTTGADPLAPVRGQLARGELAAAEATCRAALEAAPADARTLGLLAHVLHRAGRLEEAFDLSGRALDARPDFPPALMERAATARALGRWAQARDAIEALLRLTPGKAALHFDLGTTLAELGAGDAARACLERALELDPALAEAEFALAGLDLAAGGIEAAYARYTRCTSLRPGWAEAWRKRAECLLATRQPEDAILAAQEALRAQPDVPASLRVYAKALYEAKRDYAEWIWVKRRIAEVQPGPRNKVDLALALWEGLFYREAATVLDEAVAQDPDFWAARWGRFQYPLELFPQDREVAGAYLAQWRAGLADMERRVEDEPGRAADMQDCLLLCTNFYLHYLGEALVEEQRRYGRLVHRMSNAVAPGVAPARPIAAPGTRRRIGFASPFLHEHTITKLFGRFMTGLDRDAFEVHVFMLEDKADARTESLRAQVDQLHVGKPDLAAWIARLQAADLDVLVFPDIGMHPITQALGGLRFAPVQCVLWGHPVTPGLPSIDYFLSSDAMEAEGAQAHYNERLVRLPNLGTCYVAPTTTPALPPSFVPRDGDGAVEIFFAQSVYKFTPEHDEVFARICLQLPGARFHLLPHPQPHVRYELQERMRKAFVRHGLELERHVVFHPAQRFAGFLGIARACDLNMDSIGWSGGNTTLEILSLDVPTVTLPGALMRARHTAAILRRIGQERLIAADVDDYVRLVVELGADPARRAALRAEIAARKHLLYEDLEVVEAMNTFLATVMPPRGDTHPSL